MRGRQHLSCRWSRLPSPQWWLSASPITWVMSAALGSNSSSICRLPAPFDAAAPGDEDLVRRCSRAGCYSVDTSKTGHEFSCWDSCNSYVPPHESLSIAICASSPPPPLQLTLAASLGTKLELHSSPDGLVQTLLKPPLGGRHHPGSKRTRNSTPVPVFFHRSISSRRNSARTCKTIPAKVLGELRNQKQLRVYPILSFRHLGCSTANEPKTRGRQRQHLTTRCCTCVPCAAGCVPPPPRLSQRKRTLLSPILSRSSTQSHVSGVRSTIASSSPADRNRLSTWPVERTA